MPTSKRVILIVDNEDARIQALRRAFAADDPSAELRTASSLAGYREAVSVESPTAAVLALTLPDGSALDVLAAGAVGFPILVLLSPADEQAGSALIRAGALDCITDSVEGLADTPHFVDRALWEWRLREARREAERALGESEERYRDLVENLHDVVYQIDGSRRLTFSSPAVQGLLGYTAAEVVGQVIDAYIHPEDRAQARANVQFVLQGHARPNMFRLRARDGQYRWVRTSSRAQVRNGQVVGLIGVMTDVTEQRRADLALQQRERELQTLVENAPDVIVRFDRECRHVYVNPVVEQEFGMPPATLLGKTHRELGMAAGQADWSEGLIRKVFETGTEVVFELTSRVGGAERHFLARGVPEFAPDGSVESALFVHRNITERKAAEQALRAAKERLELTQTAAGVGAWDWDVMSGAMEWSPKLFQLFGLDRDKDPASFASWRSVLHPEDREVAEARVSAALEQHTDLDSEYRILRAGGDVRWISALGRGSYDEHGRSVRMSGICADVTERRRAADDLLASERRFRALIEHSHDAVTLLATDGTVLYDSPSIAHVLGYEPNERVGRSVFDLVHPDDRQRMAEGFARFAEHPGAVAASAARFLHKDGSVRDVEGVRTNLLQDPAVGAVVVNFRDVTERKRAEQALRESETRSRALLEAMPDLMFRLSRAGVHIDFHAPSLDRLYARPADFLGRNVREVLPAEAAERYLSNIEQVLARRAMQVFEYELDFAPLETRQYEARMTPCGPDDVLVLVRDVTARKRAETERLELERRLLHAQKLESLGVLAGGIAHDFNNLLMGILGSLDLAREDLAPHSPAQAGIEQAVQATRRAADLTRQMLAYSGKGKFVVTRMDLSDLARENADLFRTVVARSVSFNVSHDGPCPIEADPGQVEQVIMNLITNASDALADRPGVVSLTTGVRECDESCLARSRLAEKPAPGRFAFVEVSDNGCGMDEATQECLFDPFFTTKFTGRGLGMAAVLGIVRGHGGAITVDSAPERGTTVCVLFPACVGGEAKTAPMSAPPVDRPADASRPGAVLVVDDEESVRAPSVTFLKRRGLEALTAHDGASALTLLEARAGEIKCVILDLTMPGMDGVTAFREMKRIAPEIKVILSSGFSEEAALQDFGSERPDGFIQKPYRLEALRRVVEAVLDEGGRDGEVTSGSGALKGGPASS